MKLYYWNPLSGYFNSTPVSRQEKAYIGFSKEQLYQVVADVANYKSFLPWCTNSVVHSTSLGYIEGKPVMRMEATLEIGFPPFYKEQYTSSVTLVSNEYIQARLHQKSKNQLLRDLRCDWKFEPDNEYSKSPRSTKVTFDLKFAFASATHQSVANMVFGRVAHMMGDAFIKRCEKVFGPPIHAKKLIECKTEMAPMDPNTTTTTTSVSMPMDKLSTKTAPAYV